MRLLTLAIFALCASVANAATFNVSTVSELEDALTISRTNGEADTIVMSEGVYFVSSSAFNRLNLGDSDNELTIEGDSNLNPEQIIFDGATTNYLFFISNPLHKISIKNLTIQNAVEPLFIGSNDTYPVEISNVNFLNNKKRAIYHSGGYASSTIKTLIIKNSIFKGNSDDSAGGAIASMNLLVDNSRFENNTAPDGGGAIHYFNSSYPYNCSVYNSEFVGNSSNVGSTNGVNDIWGAGHILNSIFDGLGSSSPSQPSVRLNSNGSLLIANNLFVNNELDLKFVNSKVFLINNVLNSIDAYIGANLYHNVFTQAQSNMSRGAWVDVSNSYNSSISFDANYKTTAYDLVVGKGYDPLVLDEFKDNQLLIDAMQTDYEGNPRILGTIDIGQIEYDIDTDINPPELLSVEFNKTVLDFTEGPQLLSATIAFNDESTVDFARIDLELLGSQNTIVFSKSSANATGIVTIEREFIIDEYPSGSFEVSSLRLVDSFGNSKWYSRQELDALNVPSSIIFSGGVEDINPPELLSVEFNKTVLDFTEGPQILSATIAFNDESTVDFARIDLELLGSQNTIVFSKSSANATGIVTIEREFIIDEYPSGSFEVSSLRLVDSFGNSKWYSRQELDALNVPSSIIFSVGDDIDNDGMPDDWELANGLDPTNINDGALDADEDGLTNLDEFNAGSNPNLTDTDEDGLSDYDEVKNHGTNPNLKDTDRDGMDDKYEIDNGYDPFDGSDCPSWMCGSSNIWRLLNGSLDNTN